MVERRHIVVIVLVIGLVFGTLLLANWWASSGVACHLEDGTPVYSEESCRGIGRG